MNKLDQRPTWFIAFEAFGVISYVLLFCYTCFYLFTQSQITLLILFINIFIAIFMADLFSGLVHYFADNIGDEDTPLFGPALIRPFREHHVDPDSILRHDFIETNGSLYLIGSIVLSMSLYFDLFIHFTLIFTLFQANTNQIHKWAHMKTPPKLIRLFMNLKLLLSSEHHKKHHSGNIDSHYCITTGWLNSIF